MDHSNDALISTSAPQIPPARARRVFKSLPRAAATVLAAACLAFAAGCQTPAATSPAQAQAQAEEGPPPAQDLRQGDVIQVSFPGAPNLDTKQQIRMDGRITLPIIGDVVAAGKTPSALQQDLVKQYASQLVSKEVTVTVISSTFSVIVSGAVNKPGKVESDHPLTALDAVMLAGGFDTTKADMKDVLVIRQKSNTTERFSVNLKAALDGQATQPFYLKQSDIVYVPEKFSWF